MCVLACVRVRPRPEVMESFLLAFTKHPPSQDPLFLCGTGGRRTPPPRGTKQGSELLSANAAAAAAAARGLLCQDEQGGAK